MSVWGIGIGPAAPVLESVFGSVAGVVGQGSVSGTPGATGNVGMQTALGNMRSAFSGLFGRTQGYLPACPLQPPAFGTGAIPADIQQNPAANLQSLLVPLQQLQGNLQQIAGSQPAAAGSDPASAPSVPASPSPATGDFSYLDNMEQQIQSLMQSSNPSDQLQAQMMMNEFSQQVGMITAMLNTIKDLETKIAQGMA